MPVLPPTEEFDLRQKRSRDLHEIEPAPHACGREAGEVSDHAATKRNDEIVTLDPCVNDQARRPSQMLRSFSKSRPQARQCACYQYRPTFSAASTAPEMKFANRIVGHDCHARAGPECLDPLTERRNKPAPDDDVVSARTKRHWHLYRLNLSQGRRHDFFSMPRPRQSGSLAMISSMMVSCGSSRDCTIMSDIE